MVSFWNLGNIRKSCYHHFLNEYKSWPRELRSSEAESRTWRTYTLAFDSHMNSSEILHSESENILILYQFVSPIINKELA